MHQASLNIALKLDYKHIPVPRKITIQLEPGEINLFKRIRYAQHDTDPLSATKLVLKYAAGQQLQIAMQLTGRILLRPGGEFKFGGTKLILVCKPVIAHNKLMLTEATIKEVEFPMIPRLFRAFVSEIVNKSFVPNLGKSLHFDLETILEEIINKVNELEPIKLEIGGQKFLFHVSPNIKDGSHELLLTHEGVHLKLHLAFSPQFQIFG